MEYDLASWIIYWAKTISTNIIEFGIRNLFHRLEEYYGFKIVLIIVLISIQNTYQLWMNKIESNNGQLLIVKFLYWYINIQLILNPETLEYQEMMDNFEIQMTSEEEKVSSIWYDHEILTEHNYLKQVKECQDPSWIQMLAAMWPNPELFWKYVLKSFEDKYNNSMNREVFLTNKDSKSKRPISQFPTNARINQLPIDGYNGFEELYQWVLVEQQHRINLVKEYIIAQQINWKESKEIDYQ